MQGYAREEVFTKEHIFAWIAAMACVKKVPERSPRIRCHELTRAVHKCLMKLQSKADSWLVCDGHYGAVEHSWLYDSWRAVVLDVYAVGRLPMVQLIDCSSAVIAPMYSAGRDRSDVNEQLVSALVDEMSKLHPARIG